MYPKKKKKKNKVSVETDQDKRIEGFYPNKASKKIKKMKQPLELKV